MCTDKHTTNLKRKKNAHGEICNQKIMPHVKEMTANEQKKKHYLN